MSTHFSLCYSTLHLKEVLDLKKVTLTYPAELVHFVRSRRQKYFENGIVLVNDREEYFAEGGLTLSVHPQKACFLSDREISDLNDLLEELWQLYKAADPAHDNSICYRVLVETVPTYTLTYPFTFAEFCRKYAGCIVDGFKVEVNYTPEVVLDGNTFHLSEICEYLRQDVFECASVDRLVALLQRLWKEFCKYRAQQATAHTVLLLQ